MTGAIVKFHNDLNVQPLRGFRSGEMDMFMAIISKVRDHGENEVTFTFDQLRSLCNYKDRHPDRLIRNIKSTNDKLLNIKGSYQQSDRKIIGSVLFHKYEIDPVEQTLRVKVSPEFTYLVNDLIKGNWTRFDLKDYVRLTSRYAKALFSQLKQWRFKGEKTFALDEFRRCLDIPISYKTIDVDRKVLKPALKELGSCFDSLHLEKQYTKQRRGRPSISGYKFSWKPEPMPTHQVSKKNICRRGGKSYMVCPVCHKKAVLELQTRDGRRFWKCERCQSTFGSIAELKAYAEEPDRVIDTEVSSEKPIDDVSAAMPYEISDSINPQSEDLVDYDQVQKDTKKLKNNLRFRTLKGGLQANKYYEGLDKASVIPSHFNNEYANILRDYIEQNEIEEGQCVVEYRVLRELFKPSGQILSEVEIKQILLDAVEALKPYYKKIEIHKVNWPSHGSDRILFNIEFRRND